jgi:Spy/CpxP family protein refolding chaperone
MKAIIVIATILMLPLAVLAQTETRPAPQAHGPSAPTANPAPAFPFPGGFNPPAGLFDEFWTDPAINAELHLSDTQRKQLRDAALNQRLALIDAGADALKALARISAVYEADQLDDAAYKREVNALANATGKVVQDLGEMAAAPRRVLTVEQWQMLQKLRRAKQAERRSSVQRTPSQQPRADSQR